MGSIEEFAGQSCAGECTCLVMREHEIWSSGGNVERVGAILTTGVVVRV